MESNFSKNQKLAITTTNPLIVVSAAAGSGKTRVLIERILRHVRAGVRPEDLLVVTFTDAAASEMRERLYNSMAGDAALRAHAPFLSLANIRTVHSFCRRLLTENFEHVGIDPAFSVMGDAVSNKIKAQVMDALFLAEHERGDAAFLDLVDVYGGRLGDDGLRDLVLSVHDFLAADVVVDETKYMEMFDANSADLSPWFHAAREELGIALSAAVSSLERAAELCRHPDGPEKYLECVETDLAQARQLTASLSLPPEQLYDTFKQATWQRMPAIRGARDVELKDRALRLRTAAKDIIAKITKNVFFAPYDKMLRDMQSLWPRMCKLLSLARSFSDAFQAEKQRRAVLDFLDLERFAIRLLQATSPDAPAHFHEVLVDEYQDTNPMQELIFSLLSPRRFIVGDVCQSIYGFRRSTPALFVKLLNSGDASRIDLMENFRSHKDILNVANFFFGKLFCESLGGVRYSDGHALIAGHGDYPSVKTPRIWVDLLQTDSEEADSDDDTPENIPAIIAETRLIASIIHEVLATQDVTLGGIVILTRSMTGLAKTVVSELFACGVAASVDRGEGFFGLPEVRMAMNVLTIIDNPRQDIPLAGVLQGAHFGFSADLMIEIANMPIEETAHSKTGGALYDKLAAFSEGAHHMAHMARDFLATLGAWRDSVSQMRISRFLGEIYAETDFFGLLVGSGADLRKRNLLQLEDVALEFEAGGGIGLYRFLEHVAWLAPKRSARGGPKAAQPETMGCVRIMTIHGSKGLEFPVVICAFLGRRFNMSFEREPIVFSPTLGLGAKYVCTRKKTRSNTLQRASILALSRREALSEELRCLYVATTRARDMLILTGAARNVAALAKKHGLVGGSPLPLHTRLSASRYLDWILACLASDDAALDALSREKSVVRLQGASVQIRVRTGVQNPPDRAPTKEPQAQQPDSAIQETTTGAHFEVPVIARSEATKQSICSSSSCSNGLLRFARNDESTKYAHMPPTPIPSKLSISEIRRLYDITPHSTPYTRPPLTFEPPKFLQATSAPSPAKRGRAMHMLVQWLDFTAHTNLDAIKSLHSTLLEKNFIEVGDLDEANFVQALKLVHSNLGARIARASKLWRETPFVLRVPARTIYPTADPADRILVHGIIDCHFVDDAGLTLVDFKSGGPPFGTSPEEWVLEYRVQIGIYAKALHATLGVEPVAYIYSFAKSAAFLVPTK